MVRLTAGTWRGRKLEIPPGIRPTTELARKAAFDILGEAVVGARVLDACAGSGAYGLEALSRGAAHATFVEADRGVARVLRGNVERLGAGEQARIEEMSVARFSSKGEEGRARRQRRLRSRESARRVGASVVRRGLSRSPFRRNPNPPNPTFSFCFPSCARAAGCFTSAATTRSFVPSGLEPADRRRYGTTRFLIFRPSRDRQPC